MNIKTNIQEDCLNTIRNIKYAGAILGTGAGKTLLGIKHMAELYHDSIAYLVVAPKVSIFEEWINQANQFGYKYLIPHIKFTTYLSLSKQNSKLYDQVYLDECHNLKIKHCSWLEKYNKGVLGLTGTYPRNKFSESYQACSKFCPKLFEYNIDQAINDNMLNNYKIYVHFLELNKKRPLSSSGKSYSRSESEIYNYWSRQINNQSGDTTMLRIMRMKEMQKFNTKVNYAKRLLNSQEEKTLVFVDYINQAEKICEYTYHSKNKSSKENLENFKNGKIKKLSSVMQLSEGINIPNLKVGIILHSYANEKKLRQKIGRFLRLNPNDTSIIHLLVYNNTIDLDWAKQALKDFDKQKIFKYNEHQRINTIQ